eukprot:TRINITY_DN3237_c0_g1_i1.p1 TRINITY_DN3237_c0_g1~~TRINITY_DN3237_c0_g1_i1.p1  ORF type:complete len:409 (-),score=95.05 TRINITY_DN3237_c0_g1_i1:238-1464(-)
MPLPQRRVRFRHIRGSLSPDREYSPRTTVRKRVQWAEPLACVRSCQALKFEEIVGVENKDYWMGFAEDRMEYVRQLDVSVDAFCDMEQKAVLIQREWRARSGFQATSSAPVPECTTPRIPRSVSTEQLIWRTQSTVQLKPSLRKSLKEAHVEKLRIATAEAEQRAERRFAKKRAKRDKRRALRAEGCAGEQALGAIVEVDRRGVDWIVLHRAVRTFKYNWRSRTPRARVPVARCSSLEQLNQQVATRFLRSTLASLSSSDSEEDNSSDEERGGASLFGSIGDTLASRLIQRHKGREAQFVHTGSYEAKQRAYTQVQPQQEWSSEEEDTPVGGGAPRASRILRSDSIFSTDSARTDESNDGLYSNTYDAQAVPAATEEGSSSDEMDTPVNARRSRSIFEQLPSFGLFSK